METKIYGCIKLVVDYVLNQNNMKEVTLKEHNSRIAKLSWKSRTKGKSKKEISEMMSKTHKGIKYK